MSENPYESPREASQSAVDRRSWPPLVRLGLWGLPNRASAWAFFWLSMILAAGCIAYGFVHPLFFTGGLLVLAALWYYLAIRWVEQHSRWS